MLVNRNWVLSGALSGIVFLMAPSSRAQMAQLGETVVEGDLEFGMTTGPRGGAAVPFLGLRTKQGSYRLESTPQTEVIGIKKAGTGQHGDVYAWDSKGLYRVAGALSGKTITMTRIEYLGPAPTPSPRSPRKKKP